MSEVTKAAGFKKHAPVDSSDPGFTIPDKKLRWVSGKVSERNVGRVWVVVKQSSLPKEIVEHLSNYNPTLIASGDVIRRGDLVLAQASNEAVAQVKQEKLAEARAQQAMVQGSDRYRGATSKDRIIITDNDEEDVTQEMLSRFKMDKKGE